MICQRCEVRYKKDPIFDQCPACGRPSVVKWSFEYTEGEAGDLRVDCRGSYRIQDCVDKLPSRFTGDINITLH